MTGTCDICNHMQAYEYASPAGGCCVTLLIDPDSFAEHGPGSPDVRLDVQFGSAVGMDTPAAPLSVSRFVRNAREGRASANEVASQDATTPTAQGGCSCSSKI